MATSSLILADIFSWGLGILVVALLVAMLLFFNFVSIWVRAFVAGAPVGFLTLIFMRLRGVPPGLIVDNRITSVKAGLAMPTDPLEAHFLAGGNVNQVILALIAADKAGIALDFNRACAIDLTTKGTGKTVLEAVRASINPKSSTVRRPAAARSPSTVLAKDASA
jgi:uncharacterized protein YqfA (UPF0365 family)